MSESIITGVVLAGGLASRFGGKVKGLTPVGPKGESAFGEEAEGLRG